MTVVELMTAVELIHVFIPHFHYDIYHPYINILATSAIRLITVVPACLLGLT